MAGVLTCPGKEAQRDVSIYRFEEELMAGEP